jgi:hypothetical protein
VACIGHPVHAARGVGSRGRQRASPAQHSKERTRLDDDSRDLLTRMRHALDGLEHALGRLRDALDTFTTRAAQLQDDFAALCTQHAVAADDYPELTQFLRAVEELRFASDGLDSALVAGARADLTALAAALTTAEGPEDRG